ncbi:MAG TPA: sulfite exporter TauE/SafE family protein [Longimicrobiales bacterium]
MELVLLTLVAVLAGAVASVAGFGIGSLLTPALAPELGVRLAVVAVAIPHAAGTALRFWRLRRSIDRGVLRAFGVASAIGGLAGALLHGVASSPALAVVFGLLLIMSGLAGLTGWIERIHLRGRMAIVAGALSGLFGGIVGNQGGIRTAALLAFPLRRDAFIATATATALIVDAARLPVYLANVGPELAPHAGLIALLTPGVVVGTLIGERVLRRIPEPVFKRTVSILLLALGAWMLFDTIR